MTAVLPEALVRLFPGAPRSCKASGATVSEVIDDLNRRWPGMRARLCDGRPSIRQHILVFVDGERATLASPVGQGSEVRIVPAISGG